MSELRRVADWNARAGVGKKFRSLDDSSVLDQKTYIEEEMKELQEGFDNNDIREVLDACGDLLVVVSGLIHRLGYDPEEVLQIINDSNYSKFITNGTDVDLTLDKYESDHRYTDIMVDADGVVWGTVVETGSKKILKGINYQEPALEKLPRVD